MNENDTASLSTGFIGYRIKPRFYTLLGRWQKNYKLREITVESRFYTSGANFLPVFYKIKKSAFKRGETFYSEILRLNFGSCGNMALFSHSKRG